MRLTDRRIAFYAAPHLAPESSGRTGVSRDTSRVIDRSRAQQHLNADIEGGYRFVGPDKKASPDLNHRSLLAPGVVAPP